MALTNAELFAHAEHCLRTGQPKLANLYMRKLIERVQAERKQIRKDWYAARKQRDDLDAVVAVFEETAELVATGFKIFADALAPVAAALNSAFGNLDFTQFDERGMYRGSYDRSADN